MNLSIINAQRNAHTDNRMRLHFRCIEWEGDRGCLIDRFKCQYEIAVEDLCEECSGSLDVSGAGPYADVKGWDPHRGTPGTGNIRNGK
jgi:hypothetical protein